jgi:hypothetical protein
MFRNILSKSAKWVVPYSVVELLRRQARTRRINRLIEFRSTHLDRFRNKHLGERCFILATGPSIKSQDLSKLEGQLSIAVSFFYLHDQIHQIRPQYHLFAPNHDPFGFDLPEKYLSGVGKTYNWPSDIFYGDTNYSYSISQYLARNKIGNEVNIIKYSNSEFLNEKNFRDNTVWDLAIRPFAMRTVIYGAIQLAVLMGVKEIVLLGCDHDYLSEVGRISNHFYEENRGNEKDAEHLKKFDTERWFFEYYSRWRDYRLIKTYLEDQSIKILNATNGGMLDVFPRCSLESLLRK